MESKGISRRHFLGTSAATAGMVTMGSLGQTVGPGSVTEPGKRLPREVWIGSLSQMNMAAATSSEMVDKVIHTLDQIMVCKPDIVSLPEVFPFWGVEKKYPAEERVKQSQNALDKLSGFSRKNNCYSVCPVYTFEKGKRYNAAVIFDRKGEKIGEYRKAHLTEGEIANGLTPGPLDPPVFQTDFGIIGVQICFDMLWDDCWTTLRDKGAEIVFFASAFPAGQMVNAKAWQHKYVVVSSTCKHTAKISDITGEVIEQTGIWNPNHVCAPVNLEKAFLHLWPYNKRFEEIRQRYGRHVRISLFHEEEWAVIESLSPDVKVKDILKEYGLKTHEEHTRSATIAQEKARGE